MESPRRRKFNSKRTPSTPQKSRFRNTVEKAFTSPHRSSGPSLKHAWPVSSHPQVASTVTPPNGAIPHRHSAQASSSSTVANPFWQPTVDPVLPQAPQRLEDILGSDALPPTPDDELDDQWSSDDSDEDTDAEDEVEANATEKANKKPKAVINNTIVSFIRFLSYIIANLLEASFRANAGLFATFVLCHGRTIVPRTGPHLAWWCLCALRRLDRLRIQFAAVQ